MKINPLHIAIAGILLILLIHTMGFGVEGYADCPEIVHYRHAGDTYPHFFGDYHGYQPIGVELPDPYTVWGSGNKSGNGNYGCVEGCQ